MGTKRPLIELRELDSAIEQTLNGAWFTVQAEQVFEMLTLIQTKVIRVLVGPRILGCVIVIPFHLNQLEEDGLVEMHSLRDYLWLHSQSTHQGYFESIPDGY